MKLYSCQRGGSAAAMSLSVALLLGACSQTPERPPDSSPAPFELVEDYEKRVIRYAVQRGDMLSDIALELTGDHLSWRSIATYNGIDNPRSLREGSVLEIPMALVPGYDRENPRESLEIARMELAREAAERETAAREQADRAQAAREQAEREQAARERAEREQAARDEADRQAAADESAANAEQAQANGDDGAPAGGADAADASTSTTGDSTAESSAPATSTAEGESTDDERQATVATPNGTPVSVASPGTQTTDVELAAVEREPAFDAVPLDDTQDGPAAGSRRSVRVIGTYYPKGVYAQPTASAELLMRVAPGSEFLLERTVDNWYRVLTDDGTGYIRSSDARIVEAQR